MTFLQSFIVVYYIQLVLLRGQIDIMELEGKYIISWT